MEIRDASALVTGAGRGIGRSDCARPGPRGGAPHRRVPDGARAVLLVGEIEAVGGRGVAFAGDLRSPSACAGAVAAAVECFGGLQILINNAGLGVFANVGGHERRGLGRRPRHQPHGGLSDSPEPPFPTSCTVAGTS